MSDVQLHYRSPTLLARPVLVLQIRLGSANMVSQVLLGWCPGRSMLGTAKGGGANVPKNKTSWAWPVGNHFWRRFENGFSGNHLRQILGVSKGLNNKNCHVKNYIASARLFALPLLCPALVSGSWPMRGSRAPAWVEPKQVSAAWRNLSWTRALRFQTESPLSGFSACICCTSLILVCYGITGYEPSKGHSSSKSCRERSRSAIQTCGAAYSATPASYAWISTSAMVFCANRQHGWRSPT